MKCKGLAVPFSGTVYRAVAVKRANQVDLFSGEGSRLYGGRWNPAGSFRTVYASTEVTTAVEESLAQSRRNGLPDYKGLPLAICSGSVSLDSVLDLTDGNLRQIIKYSHVRMTKDPHGTGTESVSQAIGRLASYLGFEGLLVPSAAVRGGVNVVIFPDNLKPGVRIIIQNEKELPPGDR